MATSYLLYFLAALAEIAGCFAVWSWSRGTAGALVLLPGAASLAVFAWLLTRLDSPAAGRVFAAYGGVYNAASLGWLLLAEGVRPTSTDLLGGAVSLLGAGIILWGVRG